MRALRVLVDHQIFLMQTFGGVSRYFVETVSAMRERESAIQARIFAPLHRNAYLAAKREISRGYRGPSFRGVGRLFALNEAVTSIYNLATRPDVVHETYYRSNRAYSPSQKVVTTVYDMIHELFPEQFANSETSHFKRLAVSKADHVLAISERTRTDLLEMYSLPPHKVTTVHLGVKFDPGSATPPTQAIARPYILYVGNRTGYKNFEALAKAIGSSALLRRDILLVCFGGARFGAQELQQLAAHGLSSDRILHLVGGDDLLAWLYVNAEMLVYPSRYEGFGIPPLEAMQCNCPVVCSNAGSLPEVVGEAAAVFDPNDSDQLRQVIEKVLLSAELRNDLRGRGLSRARMFSWDNCARKTAEVYRKVVSQ